MCLQFVNVYTFECKFKSNWFISQLLPLKFSCTLLRGISIKLITGPFTGVLHLQLVLLQDHSIHDYHFFLFVCSVAFIVYFSPTQWHLNNAQQKKRSKEEEKLIKLRLAIFLVSDFAWTQMIVVCDCSNYFYGLWLLATISDRKEYQGKKHCVL